MISYKIKVYTTENKHHTKDGVLFAKPVSAAPMVGKDNKMFLSYKLGMDIEVPAGMIGLILAPNESSIYSVSQTGNFVLMPGLNKDVTIEYKINTDSIPRVFEQDEVCAQIVFLSTASVQFETVIVSPEPATKQDQTVDPEPVMDGTQNEVLETANEDAVSMTLTSDGPNEMQEAA